MYRQIKSERNILKFGMIREISFKTTLWPFENPLINQLLKQKSNNACIRDFHSSERLRGAERHPASKHSLMFQSVLHSDAAQSFLPQLSDLLSAPLSKE